MKKLIYCLVIIVIGSLFSCTYNKWEDIKPTDAVVVCDTSRIITYSVDVTNLINSSCGSTDINCHSSAASSMIPLDSYVGVQYFASTGQIMNSVNYVSGTSPMPKSQPKLSVCDIALLQKWVNEGAPNN